MKGFKLNLIEFSLILLVFYWALWLWNAFVALYICLCFAGISLFALMLIFLAEKIEPSRAGTKRLFAYYAASVAVPLFVSAMAVYVFKISTFIELK